MIDAYTLIQKALKSGSRENTEAEDRFLYSRPVIGDREPVKLQADLAAEIRLGGQAVELYFTVGKQRHHDVGALVLPGGEVFAEPLVGRRLRRRGETAKRSTTDPER